MSNKYFIALLLPALFGACSESETKNAGASKGGAVPVQIVVAGAEKLDNRIVSTGSVEPNEQVMIRSEVSARLVQINFKEGQQVKAGELLFQLDDVELQAQLSKLRVQSKLATRELERGKGLLAAKAISEEQFDQLESRVQELEADVQITQSKLDKTRIRAPFAGKVGLREVSPGAFVQAGQDLVRLVQDNPVKISFDIPEIYAPLVHNGQEINFKSSQSSKGLTATVYATESVIDKGSRNLRIKAVCRNNEASLLPGTFVQLELVLDEIPNALLIPAEAIVPEIDGQKVLVVRGGKAVSQKIGMGLRTPKSVQITQGLNPGDSVITTGLLQLREGSPVQVIREER